MEKPILFSGPMIRAILEGRKTQTRRIIKSHPLIDCGFVDAYIKNPDNYVIHDCPFGKPGDLLWIRESWQYITKAEDECFDTRRPADNCPVELFYRADAAADGWLNQCSWRPSIFMPRWASRLTLEIMDIHLERLQDTGENDAIAEGVIPEPGEHHLTAFIKLWDSINAKRGYCWDMNPWVWVIEFKVVNGG